MKYKKWSSDYNIEQNLKIYKLHQEGLSYNEIGKIYGFSGQRAKQIYDDVENRFPNINEFLKHFTYERMKNQIILNSIIERLEK